jgi:hypothetical protein
MLHRQVDVPAPADKGAPPAGKGGCDMALVARVVLATARPWGNAMAARRTRAAARATLREVD